MYSKVELREYCDEIGITLKTAIKYSSYTNAIIERVHPSISTALACLIEKGLKKNEIIKTIRMIMRAHNNTPSAQLEGYSPASIIFAEEDRFKKNKYDIPTEGGSPIHPKEIEDIRRRIPEILQQNYDKYASYHNQHFRDIKINVGDLILLENTLTRKTDQTYVGPFKVKQIPSPTLFVIDYYGEDETVHARRIKKYKPRENNYK